MQTLVLFADNVDLFFKQLYGAKCGGKNEDTEINISSWP